MSSLADGGVTPMPTLPDIIIPFDGAAVPAYVPAEIPPFTESFDAALTVPTPTFPFCNTLNAVVPTESPPANVLVATASVAVKYGAEIEVVAMSDESVTEPSKYASPATESFAKGEVVPMPTFPFVFWTTKRGVPNEPDTAVP